MPTFSEQCLIQKQCLTSQKRVSTIKQCLPNQPEPVKHQCQTYHPVPDLSNRTDMSNSAWPVKYSQTCQPVQDMQTIARPVLQCLTLQARPDLSSSAWPVELEESVGGFGARLLCRLLPLHLTHQLRQRSVQTCTWQRSVLTCTQLWHKFIYKI